MILAIDASKVAAAEENITDTLLSAYHRFLTPVDTDGRNGKTSTGSAIARRLKKSVHPALPGAEGAFTQNFNMQSSYL